MSTLSLCGHRLTRIIRFEEQMFANVCSSSSEKEIHPKLRRPYSYLVFRISMTTNVINPILYAWLNPSFKEILLKTIRRKPKITSKTPLNTVIRVSISPVSSRYCLFCRLQPLLPSSEVSAPSSRALSSPLSLTSFREIVY